MTVQAFNRLVEMSRFIPLGTSPDDRAHLAGVRDGAVEIYCLLTGNNRIEVLEAVEQVMQDRQRTHELRTWPEHFAAVAAGTKRFEVRRDDRDFAVGDTLRLAEWDPVEATYTGRTVTTEVTYVLRDADVLGVQPGFVVLSIVTLSADLGEPDVT